MHLKIAKELLANFFSLFSRLPVFSTCCTWELLRIISQYIGDQLMDKIILFIFYFLGSVMFNGISSVSCSWISFSVYFYHHFFIFLPAESSEEKKVSSSRVPSTPVSTDTSKSENSFLEATPSSNKKMRKNIVDISDPRYLKPFEFGKLNFFFVSSDYPVWANA